MKQGDAIWILSGEDTSSVSTTQGRTPSYLAWPPTRGEGKGTCRGAGPGTAASLGLVGRGRRVLGDGDDGHGIGRLMAVRELALRQ